ncbi:Fpg/Nei family DNA glycosylase [Arthrobacter sp. JSM 101049]|uniref:Fpg/Nei family DNA glycosylase n=1 Tax=Arthrobacter sp. JSM 101049 TaxID=929097 RepID=UPI003569933B
MPEGHSVHRLARQLTDVFAGQHLRVSSPQGRFAAGAALLDGREFRAATAHGKQLFARFSGGHVLRVHLGLYGAFSFGGDETFRGASSIGAPRRIGEREMYDGGTPVPYEGPPEPVGQVRARLVSAHGWADLRGASACEVLSVPEAAAVRARLGPDPLAPGVPEAGREEFIQRLGATGTVIATALMNQALVAGVGNIYRAEALFRAGLDPWTRGRDVPRSALGELWDDLCALMADGVREGHIITTRPEHRADRQAPVWPDHAYYTYQRQGLPCLVCGTPIGLTELATRKLYWCPGCQRPGAE